MKINKDLALVYGLELRRIMKTDAFKAAVAIQRDEYRRRFFNTTIGQTADRERAYQMNLALDDLLNAMSAFVFQAEQNELSVDEEDLI